MRREAVLKRVHFFSDLRSVDHFLDSKADDTAADLYGLSPVRLEFNGVF